MAQGTLCTGPQDSLWQEWVRPRAHSVQDPRIVGVVRKVPKTKHSPTQLPFSWTLLKPSLQTQVPPSQLSFSSHAGLEQLLLGSGEVGGLGGDPVILVERGAEVDMKCYGSRVQNKEMREGAA